jgi:cysteine synthase A
MIFSDHSKTAGNTPLVALNRVGGDGRIAAKLEMRNPCGSVKDRLGIALVEDAERRSLIGPGATLVEATGGNTGVGLAFVAAIRGYRLILTMPDSMSTERVALLQQLGAEIVLTPGILMTEAVAQAKAIAARTPGAYLINQFDNPANPEIHRRTTGPEIWEQTQGGVDVFVSAIGTGGTVTGVGELLKERKPSVKVIGVEPSGAALLSGGKVGQHAMPGIGVGFVPSVLNRGIIDEVQVVTDQEAIAGAQDLARRAGILAGVSSGAALCAALRIAQRPTMSAKLIVVLLADTGERYITTRLFRQQVRNAL